MNNKTLSIVIIILFILLVFKMCNSSKKSITTTIVTHDTTYITKDSTIYVKSPKLIKTDTMAISEWDTMYLPDTNYNKLKEQYINNTKELLSKRIYSDSIPYDSFNYVKITDTLQLNKLIGRDVFFHLTDKTITTTITRQQPKTNQVYLGVGLIGNKSEFVKGIEANIAFKNKQDKIIEFKSIFINNEINYGIGFKFKL